MKFTRKMILLASGLAVVAMPVIALTLTFTFSTIDPPGSTFTFPFGINPQGDVVGNYTGGGVNHGFLLRDGNFTTIDFPGATGTFARRIDPQGDIVGFYIAGGANHGFLLRDGKFTTIDVPGAISTLAFGINPQGDIAGWYIDSAGVNHGFLLRKGAFDAGAEGLQRHGPQGCLHVYRCPGRDADKGFRYQPAWRYRRVLRCWRREPRLLAA